MCIITYGSGRGFLRRRVLILLSLAAQLTTICLDIEYFEPGVCQVLVSVCLVLIAFVCEVGISA